MRWNPFNIENKSLGYTVTYQLEGFSYSFKTNYLQYQGYPFFQPQRAVLHGNANGRPAAKKYTKGR